MRQFDFYVVTIFDAVYRPTVCRKNRC